MKESFRLREARRKEARDACYVACIAILRDPESTTHEKFRAMKHLDSFVFPRGRKIGSPHHKEKPKAKQEQPLPQEFIDQVMETAQRELNGHQNEA